MRTPPEDLGEGELNGALSEGWGLGVASAEYAAVGGGSHHWVVADAAGGRHFVTVDDLDRKAFPGGDRDAAFEGLRGAIDTALALRRQGGLEFVVAPTSTRTGETVRRIGPRYAAAVYPYLDGSPRRFGERLAPADRADLLQMLVRLHRAAPIARPVRPVVSRRGELESALRDLDREWSGGPFSEPARHLLAGRVEGVRQLLETFDRLAVLVRAAGRAPVVTHGEPHPGNLVRARGRLLLIDWDTVGLAPPERDLWMVEAGDLARYEELSGRPVDAAAIRLYRVRWLLDDIAEFVSSLRSVHRQTADSEKAWRDLARVMDSLRTPGGSRRRAR